VPRRLQVPEELSARRERRAARRARHARRVHRVAGLAPLVLNHLWGRGLGYEVWGSEF
jgi:hypothetical protein